MPNDNFNLNSSPERDRGVIKPQLERVFVAVTLGCATLLLIDACTDLAANPVKFIPGLNK